ncbi:MAG: hypothetical protein ACI4DN_01315 [Lachnospiraceae bacterium]
MKEVKAEKEVNTGKGLVETGFFLLILNVLVAAHLWDAVFNHWQITGGALAEQAWIRQDKALSFAAFTWENAYVYFLHFLFRFFGNRQPVVLFANMFLQLAGIFFLYRGSRRLTNSVISLVTVAVLGIVSILDFSVTQDNANHLIWFFFGITLWLISFIRPLIQSLLHKKRQGPEAEKQRRDQVLQEPDMKKPDMKKPDIEKSGMEEPKPAVNRIPNPLPLPKKHVRKEMDYGFEPSKEQMHYDLNNYNVNDDYDLKEV